MGVIALAAENYFQELFTSASPSEMDTILSLVDRVVTPKASFNLIQQRRLKELSFKCIHQNL